MRRPRDEDGHEIPLVRLAFTVTANFIIQPIDAYRTLSNMSGRIVKRHNDWGYEESLLHNRVKAVFTKSAKNIKVRLTKRKKSDEAPTVNFTLFSKLPAELRVQIWRETLTPRIISAIRIPNPVPFQTDLLEVETLAQFISLDGRELPPIHHANAEARHEFLRSYSILEGSTIRKPTYFNTEIDTLYFLTAWCLRKAPPEECLIQKIQHLAIGIDYNFRVRDYEEFRTTQYHLTFFLDDRDRWLQKEFIHYQRLLLNILEFSSLKTLKLVMHWGPNRETNHKHIHTVIVNKCQQEERLKRPYEPWGSLTERDTKPEKFIDVDLPLPRNKDGPLRIWPLTDQDRLAEFMVRLKEDLDEHRGSSCPPLEISAAIVSS